MLGSFVLLPPSWQAVQRGPFWANSSAPTAELAAVSPSSQKVPAGPHRKPVPVTTALPRPITATAETAAQRMSASPSLTFPLSSVRKRPQREAEGAQICSAGPQRHPRTSSRSSASLRTGMDFAWETNQSVARTSPTQYARPRLTSAETAGKHHCPLPQAAPQARLTPQKQISCF